MEQELRIRITVERPPAGVRFAVQRGKHELVEPSATSADHLSFDLPLRVKDDGPDGAPNFLGPFSQGPRGGRFVYVNSGTSAGQHDSCWTRRAKVALGGITWDLIETGRVLETRFAGTGRDGGPSCATVPISAWKAVSS